jgi:hypothetical protein
MEEIKVKIGTPTPGTYTVHFRGSIKKTWSPFGKPWEGFDRKVRVWKPIELVKSHCDPAADGKECRISVTLRSGRAFDDGVDCTAQLNGEPNTAFQSVEMRRLAKSEVLPPPADNSGTRSISQITWSTGKLDAFQEYTADLVISAVSPLSPEQWQRTYQKLDLTPK